MSSESIHPESDSPSSASEREEDKEYDPEEEEESEDEIKDDDESDTSVFKLPKYTKTGRHRNKTDVKIKFVTWALVNIAKKRFIDLKADRNDTKFKNNSE